MYIQRIRLARSVIHSETENKNKTVRRYLGESIHGGQARICEGIPLFSLLFHVAVARTLVFTASERETGRAFEASE